MNSILGWPRTREASHFAHVDATARFLEAAREFLDAPPAVPPAPAPLASTAALPLEEPGASSPAAPLPVSQVQTRDALARSGPSAPAVPAAVAGPPLDLPFGRYRLRRRIGAGGMGVVWRAWDTELRREVALKQIRDEAAGDDDDLLARFQREARLAAKLRHPHIVTIHDVGQVDGRAYLTMDLVEGRTFHEHLDQTAEAKRRGDPQGLDRLRPEIAILADVAGAVAYAHGQGVIHRDLKPSNVLLDARGAPLVTDFGLAKELRPEPAPAPAPRPPSSMQTTSGRLIGTPAYMSPEQALGDTSGIGPGADVWALGILLYEVLTGETPFARERHAWDVLHAVVEQDPVRPRARNALVPDELDAVCLKALEKLPARRYPSAGAIENDLRRWLAGKPVEATRPGPLYRLWRFAQRHRLSATVGGVLLAALAFAGWFRWVALVEHEAGLAIREEALGSLREMARMCVDETLLARRRLDLSAGARFLPRLEGAVERAGRRLGDRSAEPEYHLGRLLRAMQRPAGALRAQEAALAKDPGFAPSRYERAVLLAFEYREALARARQAAMARRGRELRESGGLDSGGRGELEIPDLAAIAAGDPGLATRRAALAAALGELRRLLREDPGWARHPIPLLRVDPAKLACVEGLLAWAEGKAGGEAAAALERAVRSDPSLEEAWEALYGAALDAGRGEDALRACTRGIEADPGYVPHRLNRGWARHERALALARAGLDPAGDFAGAVDDFSAVVQLDPLEVRGWAGRGAARGDEWDFAHRRGEEAGEKLAAAVADFEKATALAPGSDEAWANLGLLRVKAAS